MTAFSPTAACPVLDFQLMTSGAAVKTLRKSDIIVVSELEYLHQRLF
jgi:hypothetical protein